MPDSMPDQGARAVPAALGTVVLLAAVLSGMAGGVAAAGVTSTPAAGPATLEQPGNATVDNVSYTGDAATNTSDGRLVVWQESSFELTVTYTPPNRSAYSVCAWTSETESEVCKSLSLGDPQNRTSVTFERSSWPTDVTGPLNVTVELRAEDGTLANSTHEVIVLQQNESYDGDSLSNSRELGMNTSVLMADTDSDGLNDGVELRQHGTDPTDADTDGDGLRDAREIELGTDPTDPDTDNDGLPDGREVELDTNPLEKDTDDDGLDDGREVTLRTDPTEADSDDDGLTDPRELEVGAIPTNPDSDDDGLSDGREVELGTDPTDPDTDGDGLSDSTEVSMGTDPTSATTPVTLSSGVVVTVGAVAVLSIRRTDRLAVEWDDSDRLPVAVPALSSVEDDDETTASPTQANVSRGSAELVRSTESWPNIPDQPIDPEREEVLSILQEYDGRIRQGEIVDQTDWSASKVSRMLSNMEDDEQISKVTVGRENIITLYGNEPGAARTDADSPASSADGESNSSRSEGDV